MSHINRTEGIFRGLRIHNKDNNLLEMNQNGNYRLSSKNITNYSFNGINNISEKDSIYKSNSNLILGSENGKIIIRNGNEIIEPLFNYQRKNQNIEESLNIKSIEDLDEIRNDSLLIESLDKNKGICLLSNNGINQISHSNINTISDSDINLQSHRNINVNSYENIILNSERIISTVEDDIILISSHGDIKIGGDGINNIGVKINSNYNKNYVGIGNINNLAQRNLHIDVKDTIDENNKNGILINGEDKNNIYPDISLRNNLDEKLITNLSVGICDNFKNNFHFVKKINIDGKTYLESLDNYNFTLSDLNKEIIYKDVNFKKDIIKRLTQDKNIVLLNDNISDKEIEDFSYQKCYIKNSNNAYLKTITSSDLNIGVNNSNIISIKNNNNVGINNNNPTASLDISNNVGDVTNIRLDKDKKYFNTKAIQMKNGNCILFCNTQKKDLHNLEGFIYSDNNFITSFVIYENSHSYIDYDVDTLCNKNDYFGIVFNYYNGQNYTTQINIFDNGGNLIKEGYRFSHIYLEINSSPKIKSFNLELEKKIQKSGYLLAIRDMTIEGNIVSKILLFEDYEYEEVNQIVYLEEKINDFIEDNMDLKNNGKVIGKVDHKFINVDYNSNYQSFIINICCDVLIKSNLNNSEEIIYFSCLNEIFFNIDNLLLTKIIELNLENINQYKLGNNIKINNEEINMSSNYELYQCNTLLLNNISGLFKICYYVRDCRKNKIVNLIVETYKSNNSSNNKFCNFKIIDDLDLNPNNISPSISHIESNNFVIVYQYENKVKYYDSKDDKFSITGDNLEKPYLIKLRDNKGNYLSTLLLYENKNLNNKYNYNSINFEEIKSEGYIFKIKNSNNNISVKNNGNININNQIEINKEEEYTKINNLTINKVESLPEKAQIGMMCIYDNELHIYLNRNWKKIQLL